MATRRSDMEARFQQMMLAQTPARRVAMGCSMLSTAKSLVRAGILSESGGREPKDLRQRIFLRLYGRDFAPQQIRAILEYLSLQHP